jgi:hypothetical protein
VEAREGWYKFLIKPMPRQRFACPAARAHPFTIDKRYAYLKRLRSRSDFLMHSSSSPHPTIRNSEDSVPARPSSTHQKGVQEKSKHEKLSNKHCTKISTADCCINAEAPGPCMQVAMQMGMYVDVDFVFPLPALLRGPVGPRAN